MIKKQFKNCYLCGLRIRTLNPITGYVKGIDDRQPVHYVCYESYQNKIRRLKAESNGSNIYENIFSKLEEKKDKELENSFWERP